MMAQQRGLADAVAADQRHGAALLDVRSMSQSTLLWP
jgi:hypothetical protein